MKGFQETRHMLGILFLVFVVINDYSLFAIFSKYGCLYYAKSVKNLILLLPKCHVIIIELKYVKISIKCICSVFLWPCYALKSNKKQCKTLEVNKFIPKCKCKCKALEVLLHIFFALNQIYIDLLFYNSCL